MIRFDLALSRMARGWDQANQNLDNMWGKDKRSFNRLFWACMMEPINSCKYFVRDGKKMAGWYVRDGKKSPYIPDSLWDRGYIEHVGYCREFREWLDSNGFWPNYWEPRDEDVAKVKEIYGRRALQFALGDTKSSWTDEDKRQFESGSEN